MTDDLNPLQLIKHGVDACSYLIPRNARITTAQFARLIVANIDSPKAVEVAAALAAQPGLLERRWSGTSFELENDENKTEIAVRNAGMLLHGTRAPGSKGELSSYELIPTSETAQSPISIGQMVSEKAAWDKAYVLLGIEQSAIVTAADSDQLGETDVQHVRKIVEREAVDRLGAIRDDGARYDADATTRVMTAVPDVNALEKTPEPVTLYGVITARRIDRNLLTSLGVVLGTGVDNIDGRCDYLAMVPVGVENSLEEFGASFETRLHRLAHSVKPDDSALTIVPIESLTNYQLVAYEAYLHFIVDQQGKLPLAGKYIDFTAELGIVRRNHECRQAPTATSSHAPSFGMEP